MRNNPIANLTPAQQRILQLCIEKKVPMHKALQLINDRVDESQWLNTDDAWDQIEQTLERGQ